MRWFWVVQDGDGEGEATQVRLATSSTTRDVERFVTSQASVLGKIEEEEEWQARKVHDGTDHKSSAIPWVRSCGFDRHLKGLDKKEIRRSRRKPEEQEPDSELVRRVASMAVKVLEDAW